ncbi:MAG TPA: hypothetical protein VGC13_29535 [Longimicrobium sp.]|jgi:hypothetical protein|uniref:hypothetical protein n=1 Tax=Longimicrobium sp. TaxID=2029185 RepID=UPI002EDB9F0C
MDHKAAIHSNLREIAHTMLDFIKHSGPLYHEGWVPATYIKRELNLQVLCYPKDNEKQHGKQGWLFSILARLLEDEGLLEYRFDGKHAYYRAVEI